MAAQDPTYAQSHDASAWDADDGAAQTDGLTGLTDDNLSISIIKQGKSPDDILRIELPDKDGLAAGTDTVTAWTIGNHNYVTMALVPYDTAAGVDTANKITATSVTETIFTLTSGFIAALFDQGGGTWAARIVEDGEINGDVKIAEIDSNLTASAGGAITAALPIAFGVAADLKAQGKLDAALATVYGVTADLKAKGQLDAALPVVFNVVADLKAQGKLDAALAIAFTVAADLKAKGKLDAALAVVFNIVADLQDSTVAGAVSAALPVVFGVAADLKAKGKLDAALAIVFAVTANLTDATPPFVDRGLLVRYFFDEAASGTGPTAVFDRSGNSYDLDQITYDGNMTYTEISGNRGLDSTTAGNAQRARHAINDTTDLVRDAIEGTQKATLELVIRVDAVSSSFSRFWGINDRLAANGLVMLSAGTLTTYRVSINDVFSGDMTLGLGSRSVVHVVFDSTESTQADRIRVYVDGTLEESIGFGALNETISLPSAIDLIAGNRAQTSTNYNRSFDGVMFYSALYDEALTASEVSDNFDILTLDDDQPAAAVGAITAALPITFGVTADLKAQGKLDAALGMVFAITADLKAQGKLDAALAISVALVADLKARGKLDAALGMVFAVAADLKAQGKLDATLAIVLAVAADLKAQGKLDAALGMVFGVVANLVDQGSGAISAALPAIFSVVADLKAKGKLDAALPLAFNVAADLRAKGKLDAALAIVFGVVADLKAQGKLDAALDIVFTVAADLKARGKLDAALAIVFGVTASVFDASGGAIDAVLPIQFNIAAALTDATPAAVDKLGDSTISRRRRRRFHAKKWNMLAETFDAFLRRQESLVRETLQEAEPATVEDTYNLLASGVQYQNELAELYQEILDAGPDAEVELELEAALEEPMYDLIAGIQDEEDILAIVAMIVSATQSIH